MLTLERLRRAYQTARDDLLAERAPSGHWLGELSASALSTATAISALAAVLRNAPAGHYSAERLRSLIERGLGWLAVRQNDDGGWGDTDKSLSNIATTMLVRAAFHLAAQGGMATSSWPCAAHAHDDAGMAPVLDRASAYIETRGGLTGLRDRYGKDKTFAVPILTNAALAGLVEWHEVSPLPFELACLPGRWLGVLRLPVVSYAIPALVAIGQARYFHAPPRNPILRLARRLAIEPSLRVLERMQPASGGFLEATPLTSFVVMSLASIGRADHPVARRGADFLAASVRSDGSWPIDTNLATWATTLAINALAAGETGDGERGGMATSSWSCTTHCPASHAHEDVGASPHPNPLPKGGGTMLLDWLLSCQHRQVHPMTSAAAGGWGWSDLGGAVPDADDTAGALLALAHLRHACTAEQVAQIDDAAASGLRWLLELQNRDGGWPTFCRGWGALPFDRSGPDLTAHALRAIRAWHPASVAAGLARRFSLATDAGLHYLAAQQCPDGSWVPLWFGNQHYPREENPVYGTARVLMAYRDLGLLDSQPAQRGLEWLRSHQDPEGGWGKGTGDGRRVARDGGCGRSPDRTDPTQSIEETALAVEALLAAGSDPITEPAVAKGVARLVQAVESQRHREPAPIGLYFARLWYYERLYPLCFAVSALGAAARRAGIEEARS